MKTIDLAVIPKCQIEDHQDFCNIVSVRNVWSNGKTIRNYSGQGEHSTWHSPRKGYRKMIAILIEVEESDC